MGVCFWLDSSISVQTSVRRSILQPMSRMRVLGQKSRISVFHCERKKVGYFSGQWITVYYHSESSSETQRAEALYLLQAAVHSVGTADVKTQQHCVWVTVAQRPHVVIVWRTLWGRDERIIKTNRKTHGYLWFQILSLERSDHREITLVVIGFIFHPCLFLCYLAGLPPKTTGQVITTFGLGLGLDFYTFLIIVRFFHTLETFRKNDGDLYGKIRHL